VNLPQSSIIDQIADHRDELLNENRKLNQRIKRLEEVGNEMAAWLLDPRNLGGGSSMASQWHKAKEAKP
jgi:cell division septum initiation protein DivIVA